jgi:hypothetical protein
MGIMWIIWLTATFITRTAGTATIMGLLRLPELPMQSAVRMYDNYCLSIFSS